MAEVKQKSGPISLNKKPPSFNNNGVSSSFKHIYDDVFGSSSPPSRKMSSSFMEDDYAEIFGSSKSGQDECWSIPYSSVPILELQRDKGVGFRGERVDYGGVFGGFDNGGGGGFGLIDGEELFDQLKKKAKTSSFGNNLPRNQGQSIEATRLESPSKSYDEQLPTNEFSQSHADMKHLESENNKVTVKPTSRTRKAGHMRVHSLHEPVVKVDPPNTDSNLTEKQGNHYRHTSLDFSAQSSNTNGFHQSPEKININRNTMETHTPEIHPIPESTHSIHELDPTPDFQPINESNHPLNEMDSSQKTVFSKTSVLNEPQTTNDVNLVEDPKKHSCNTSLDPGSNLNDNRDVDFQKSCGLTESTSVDNSHESCDVVKDDVSIDCGKVKRKGRHSRMASIDLGDYKHSSDHDVDFQKPCGLTKSTSVDNSHESCDMVKDDVPVDCGKLKKKGRRSRMASIDLGDYKHSERDDGLKRKPRLGGSYSFDASNDPGDSRVKVHPSMMYPSSSLPRFFPVESRYKVSENSSGKFSPPSLIEELDVNSDAAISAALLQRAIEEAELRIRMAKAYLKQEGQGSNNIRFKDTLKVRVRVARENGVVNEVNKQTKGVVSEVHKQTKVNEWHPPLVDSEQNKPCAAETAQRVPVFEEERIFKDEKLADREDTKVSNSITGDDKREGEWEAAKHFNQLISGVKNKLASFISWQTETEKEVTPEMEATMPAQQHTEEINHDLKDRETSKRKRTEQNEVASTSSCEETHGEDKVRVVSEAVAPEKNEAENTVDSTRVTTSLSNFQFFAFRNQNVGDISDREVEEKEPLETTEYEMVNRQEQMIDEVETVCVPFEGEEESQEESDNKGLTQDSERQDDTLRTNVGFQNDKMVEEPRTLDEHKIKDISVEEVCEDNVIAKDDLLSVNRDKVELVEEHYVENDEEDDQECTSGKSYLSSDKEDNDELAEQPSSFAGHNEKGLPYEEVSQDDMHRFSHIGSSDKENEERQDRKDVDHQMYISECSTEKIGVEPTNHTCGSENIFEKTDEDNLGEVQEEAETQHENVELLKETWKNIEKTEEYECQENNRDQSETNHFEEVPHHTYEFEDINQIAKHTELVNETAEIVSIKDDEEFSSKVEEACEFYATNSKVEVVHFDEELEKMDMASTSEPEIDVQSQVSTEKASGLLEEELPWSTQKESDLIGEEAPESTQKPVELVEEEPVLSSSSIETEMELDRNEIEEVFDDTIEILELEQDVVLDSELDLSSGKKDPETDCLHEAGKNLHLEEFDLASDLDADRSGVEALHKRRRWFDYGGTIASERPSILEGKGIELEITQEVVDEYELAGSVEIHAGKLDSSDADITTARDVDMSYNPEDVRTNVEITPTRRKWFVKEGKPKPVSLFEDIKVNLEVPLENVNESGESLNAMNSDVAVDGEKGKQSGEAAPRRKRWFESGHSVGTSQQVKLNEDVGSTKEIGQDSKEQHAKHDSMPIPHENNDIYEKEKPEKEHNRDSDGANRKGKEKEKERIAVERAIREARERAFAEAKERARREALDRSDIRVKVASGVQEKLGKVSCEATSSSDKALLEAKLKAERAAVERATAEARERILQKALSDKGSHRSREQSMESKTSRGSESSNNNEKVEGAYVESPMRCRARLERQSRTMERAAKALEEKNRRDLLAQKEQAAKNMMADILDAEVKRWCTGKEGNLRALLSTLQYVLGPESGWQPVSLTDLIASSAVRKAYKKANLCVHPDKLQQRGATIQQKYICEKVFDLLKDAWSKFNPDDR